jgi:hypothetical protein
MTPAATPYVSLRVPPTVANVATVDTMLVVQDKSGISQLIVQVYIQRTGRRYKNRFKDRRHRWHLDRNS